MRIAVTADLHWGHKTGGEPTLALVRHLHENPPDVLVLAGDIGTGPNFEECLRLFDGLDCRKALVPGNHDLWIADGDSYAHYREVLPAVAARHGFVYLDTQGPLRLDDTVSLVGSINWYDGSWIEPMVIEDVLPDWERYVREKRFVRGRHNDGVFVRLGRSDADFVGELVESFERQLSAVTTSHAIVVAHHPPFIGLEYPSERTGPDALLWLGYTGNSRMEAVLSENAAKVAHVFCGHTHFARDCEWFGGVRGWNVGGDYPWKRLLTLTWPAGSVEAMEFPASE